MPFKHEAAVQLATGQVNPISAHVHDESDYRIYILLTKYADTVSKAVSGFSRGYYSHVSIGFDPSFDTFFSFNRKGFRIEMPENICRKKKEVPCSLYSLSVSEHVYMYMRDHVEDYLKHPTKWKFNSIGLALSIAHIPFYKRKNYRFCSQFVAEVLELHNTVQFEKRSSMMLPKDFVEVPELELEFDGMLNNLVFPRLSMQS